MTVYKKKCGCTLVLTYLDKKNNLARITYSSLCKDEEKEKAIATKLIGERCYENIDIKYQDLENAIKRGEIAVDVIETIKTLEIE